ncbi:transposase [Streptococcus pneumoniae]|nr:transposase [Streptococcus pneumoniae]
MVAGLTNGELIAPMTYAETMTSDFFEAWFQKFLLPTLNTPSVIIMDNARFRRMGKLEVLCEEFGNKLLPLLYRYYGAYFVVEKKSHMTYNEKRQNNSLEKIIWNNYILSQNY